MVAQLINMLTTIYEIVKVIIIVIFIGMLSVGPNNIIIPTNGRCQAKKENICPVKKWICWEPF